MRLSGRCHVPIDGLFIIVGKREILCLTGNVKRKRKKKKIIIKPVRVEKNEVKCVTLQRDVAMEQGKGHRWELLQNR